VEGLLGIPYELIMTDSSLVLEAFYVRPPASIVWKGDQSAQWDLISSMNWLNNDTADWCVRNDTVIFDDTGSSAATVQMTGSLPVGEVRVNSSIDYTLEGIGYISGTGKLIKSGSGTLTLSGSNEYTGGTIVDEGTLMITNTSGSATGDGVVNVNNEGILSGTGVIGGLVSINEGATLSTADNALGELAVENDLDFMTGAHLTIDVNGDVNKSDILSVEGHLHLDGILHLTDIAGGPYYRYDYFKFLDAQNITGAFSGFIPESPGENLRWDTTMIRSHGTIRVLLLSDVAEREIGQSVRIYPNPANDYLTVYFSEPPGKVLVELTDLNGRIVSSSAEAYPASMEFDLSAIDPGVYIIRIQTDSNTFTRKIIRQ
jgi:autotransporter-associated beta strand protein